MVFLNTTARLGPGLTAPRTKTVPAPNSAGRSTLDTRLDSRPRLHAVGSLGVQAVPSLLGSQHAWTVGHGGRHRSSQRCGRSLEEMHEEDGLRVLLRHVRYNTVLALECS